MIIVSCYTLFSFTWSWGYLGLCKLVATQLLKDDSLKANRSKPVSTFEPHEPYDIFAKFDMDSLLLFPTYQEGYQTARF
jgi:hypothetical protein